MNKLRVAVSGINGFVGHHLARELHNNNISVIGIGTDEKVSPEIASVVDEYYSANLIETWPHIENVDGVIHLAGLAAVGPSFDHPQTYINSNSAMVTNMCEAFLNQEKKPRIVIVSSGTIYDASQPMPLTEDSLLGFNSPYAVSKVLVENQATYYKNRGLDCIVARPFNHIGPGQKGGFILPDLASGLDQASKDGSDLMVGQLKTKRDFTDVRDVARAYRFLVSSRELKSSIYNICSGNSISGETILNLLKTQMHLETISVVVDSSRIRPNDPLEIVGDSSNLTDDTGWRPSFKIEETIRDFIDAKA